MRAEPNALGLWIALVVTSLCLTGRPVEAGTLIVPTSQDRSLSGSAYAEDPFDGPLNDSQSDQAPDFGPYNKALSADALVGGASASGGGQQTSQILAATITADGSMFANAEVWDFDAFADASSTNRMMVTFQLTNESTYTLLGEISAFDEAVTELHLLDAQGEVYGEVIFGTATTLPVNESGTLPAGEYTLEVLTSGSVFGGDFISGYSFGSYDVTLHFMPAGSAGPGGEVPDGDDVPGGMPLRVSRLPNGDVRLGWSASCRPGDVDYEVYEGEIGDAASLMPVTCSTAGLLEYDVTPLHEGSFFLVVPTDGNTEGSYGDTGAGVERTPSTGACRTQLLGAPVCP